MNQKRINEVIPAPIAQKPIAAPVVAPTQAAPPVANPAPTNKVTLVKFDQNTEQPFDVKFSKRGFSVDGTRLSFELLDQALSKNFSITLNGGSGLVLTPVRMQKILKYRDLY